MKYKIIFENKQGDQVTILSNDLKSSIKANSIMGFRCIGHYKL